MIDFEELVETESRGLQAAVIAIIGDRDRAEEIVQDAFERCFRRWSKVSKMDRPGAWARRVAINAAISTRRRSATERRTVDDLRAIERIDGGVVDPLAELGDDEVWAVVRTLPQEQAAAIALRYGADLSIPEIAETMGTTAPAVKSLLHRGRVALRGSEALRSHIA